MKKRPLGFYVIGVTTLQLASQAYPVNNGPAIKDVQFPAHWQGAPSSDPQYNPVV